MDRCVVLNMNRTAIVKPSAPRALEFEFFPALVGLDWMIDGWDMG